MANTEALTSTEISDQCHLLYKGLVEIVESTLHNGNNPDVHVRPYAAGYIGVNTFTIPIDGLITGPNRAFMDAVQDLAPGADYKNDQLPDGSHVGWRVHLPFQTHRVISAKKRRAGQRYVAASALAPKPEAQSLERVLLLWVVTGLLGAVLFLRVRSGVLY